MASWLAGWLVGWSVDRLTWLGYGIELLKQVKKTAHIQIKGVCLFFGSKFQHTRTYVHTFFPVSPLAVVVAAAFFLLRFVSANIFMISSVKKNICITTKKELSKYMELNFSNCRRHCISDIVEKFT